MLNDINFNRYNSNNNIVKNMSLITFNSKSEGIDVLTKYFRKFKIPELKYYLENNDKLSIPNFLETNVYEPEDVEVKKLLLSHLKIVLKKIFYIRTELNLISNPIKISFVSDSVYWDNIFVIKNNIFVKLKYLLNVFELIEYNQYKNISDVYIDSDEIYDIELLKRISKCVYSILQNLNQNEWVDFITTKFGCVIVPISNVVFKNKYNILSEPNVESMWDNIVVYWLDSDNIYGTFNSIYSTDNSFSPYWEQKIIKLSYSSKNDTYTEIDCVDIEKYKTKSKSFISNIISNPFDLKSIQITNTIIHNN